MEKIRILHTNDLHSHFENWPKIRRFIQERQKALAGESVITIDLGDFSDRWHPLTEASDGQANIALMNQVHYDAVTIGNNEGIGNAKAILNQLYNEADFDIVLANLFDKQTLQLPDWASSYKIITSQQGTKVGLIGVTAPFPLTYTPNGWDIRQWMDILPELVQQLRQQVDVIVLLSHLGIADDYLIAEELPEIDVVLGSHTHHLFASGERVNNTQLAAAGKFGYYVGEVTLSLNDDHHILKTTAQTFSTAEMLELPEDNEEIFHYMEQGQKLLAANKVAWLPQALTLNPYDDYSLVRETLTAVRKRGDTEVALLNTGLFLGELPEGLVNQEQLHTILPHPMRLIRVTLLGRDIVRMVLEIEKNRMFLRNYPIVGMGFRGKIFGEIIYDGLTYDAANHTVLWKGKPLESEKNYAFTTVDHLMFVPFIPTIEIAGQHEFLFPEFIRTVLGEHLAQKYSLATLE
ncbi:hypothetical protein DOK78_001051 [Enterococcus sp. DIV2402]|uniref:Uncharacterized protein n=1 Tax=Candidatus Enterococcus lowellii TaxID=2230877 RepID=A0ABZ2SKQ1_9ENTE|nr:bifunctional metallophosphatase/5'-nucleotidase [Enterococcus sp. DIV2402]MBO0465619.1 metallophosphoesterase [Enterococcus sp. DIV2402]